MAFPPTETTHDTPGAPSTEMVPYYRARDGKTNMTRYRHSTYLGWWIDVMIVSGLPDTLKFRTSASPRWSAAPSALPFPVHTGNEVTVDLIRSWPVSRADPHESFEPIQVQIEGAPLLVAKHEGAWCAIDHPNGLRFVASCYRIPEGVLRDRMFEFRPVAHAVPIPNYEENEDEYGLSFVPLPEEYEVRKDGRATEAGVPCAFAHGRAWTKVCTWNDLTFYKRVPAKDLTLTQRAQQPPQENPWITLIRREWDNPQKHMHRKISTDEGAFFFRIFEAIREAVLERILERVGDEAMGWMQTSSSMFIFARNYQIGDHNKRFRMPDCYERGGFTEELFRAAKEAADRVSAEACK